MKQKILVFCIDALCSSDIEYMKEMPNFKTIIESGSYVKHIETVYPSLTYPCHVSILTGTYVKKHGIPHNENVEVGNQNAPWFSMKHEVKVKNLLDYAREYGYSTCSLSWPVSGGADYDFNMPMIVPMSYSGYHPEKYLENTATKNLMDQYFWKYGRYIKGKDRSLDLLTMALAPDIIRDYGQADVMLIKMCDLDTARHIHGVYHELVTEQLRKHDEEFGVILESVKRYGDFENTNFIILGDHGQTDVSHVLNFNILLKQNGFIILDEEGNIVDYTAYCHSVGLSAWIQLKNPKSEEDKKRVYDFLLSVKKDPQYGLGYVYTKEESEALYGLTGPFDFVIEGEKAISFGNTLKGEDVFAPTVVGDYKISKASHGCLPFKEEHTLFIGSGPSFKKGVVVERSSMVNEAPTMAKILGFEMKDIDGTSIDDLLK